jgi:tetratricopeptide (TPR) repeat protein
MTPNANRFFHSPPSIIGRERELAAVEAALDACEYGEQVFYFEGQGGIGKTRLLLEALERSLGRERTLATEVIDLYLTRYHQPVRIMNAIVYQLRARLPEAVAGTYFADYEQEAIKFLAASGEHGDTEQERRASVDKVFLADYRRLANDYRIVLLIDTLEKLHPEIGEADIFNFSKHSRLEGWLVNQIAQLPNTLTLLAGRPRLKQRELLQEALGNRLKTFTIEPFTFAQTEAYIREALADGDEAAISADLLHQACGGRPVVLTIALACAQASGATTIGLPAGFEDQYPNNRDQLSDAFVSLIVRDLHENALQLADLLTKAIYLRKGLRVPILEQIDRDQGRTPDTEAIKRQLEEFSQYAFVKPIGEHAVILHDELYELLFNKVGQGDAQRWYRAAIHYLEQELRRARNDPQFEQNLLLALQRIQTMKVERLFYQMSLDPRHGYQEYRELSHSAINARKEDFDTQLQDELARFFDTDTVWGRYYRNEIERQGLRWDQIIYDEGIRWAHRQIASQGADRYERAIEITEQVQRHYPQLYQKHTLVRCDLETARLQAEVYIPETTPRGAEIVRNYEALTGVLEELLARRADPATGLPLTDIDLHYARFVLANAYNYWGYYERTQERLQSAIDKYKRAIYLYKQLGPEVESQHATTLNNLGFALGRQGFSDSGLECVRKALAIVSAQGLNYQIATTLNTMARLLMDINQVDAALQHVTRAHELFEQQENWRGLALCAIAEGRVRNRLALSSRDQHVQDAEFQRAVDRNREAVERFDMESELSRRIEARLFLGKVCRDWGTLLNERGADGGGKLAEALDFLRQAHDLCTSRTPAFIRASILEAIAIIHVDQGDYGAAVARLDEARALIPEEFTIAPETTAANISKTQEMRLFWLRLAQIELQYALCHFRQGDRHTGCRHLLRSFAYLLTFSAQASPLERFRELARRELQQISSTDELRDIREATRAEARQLNIRQDALTELEQLFEQIETKFLLS